MQSSRRLRNDLFRRISSTAVSSACVRTPSSQEDTLDHKPSLARDEKLVQLDRELADENLEGHWRLDVARLTPEPTPLVPANLWRGAKIRELLLRAGEIHALQSKAPRRTVRLCTPGLQYKW